MSRRTPAVLFLTGLLTACGRMAAPVPSPSTPPRGDLHPPPIGVPVAPAEFDTELQPGVTVGDVVMHFVPVWYHDTANGGPNGLGPMQDYYMAYDFDGDLRHDNNWENLTESSSVGATLYYALVATSTHYFLTFTQYHARDWEPVCTGLFTECHEGDLEDVRLVIRRMPNGLGEVELVITDAHGYLLSWSADTALAHVEGPANFESADGEIVDTFDAEHPHVRIFTQAKGHGPIPCRARESAPFGGYPSFPRVSCPDGADLDFPGDDGIVFRYQEGAATAFDPSLVNGESVDFRLISYLDSFWAHRGEIGTGLLFRPSETLAYSGDRGAPFELTESIGLQLDADQFAVDPSGNIAWKKTMPGTSQGDLFFDPALAIVARYLLADVSMEYEYHPYLPDVVAD